VRISIVAGILLLIVSILLPEVPLYAGSSPVTVYYYDRLPFFGRVGTSDEGFLLKIIRLVFDDAGIPFHFEKVPLNRIFEQLKKDGPYCMPGAFKTPDRQALYIYSRLPIYQDSSPGYIIRKNDEKKFAGIKKIDALLKSGMTLGLVKNYSHGKWIDENIAKSDPKKTIVSIGDDQAPFIRMLLLGRFDYIFAGGEEASYNIRTIPDFSGKLIVKKLDDAPEGNIRWLIFSKTFPKELLGRINDSILKVKASNAYRAILSSILK